MTWFASNEHNICKEISHDKRSRVAREVRKRTQDAFRLYCVGAWYGRMGRHRGALKHILPEDPSRIRAYAVLPRAWVVCWKGALM